MDKKKSEIRAIDTRYFYPGMFVDSEIYIEINGDFVLLCSNVMLNSMLVKRLKKASDSHHKIYVNKNAYDEIIQQGDEFSSLDSESHLYEIPTDEFDTPKVNIESDLTYYKSDETEDDYLEIIKENLEKIEFYTKISEDTEDIFQAVEKGDKVPMNTAEKITHDISNQIQKTETAIIIQCINNVRKMDDYLYTHSRNVATLNGLLAKWLGLGPRDTEDLIKTGLLHDVGKLHIPQAILNKPARLTDEEFEIIKEHPIHSYNILASSGVSNTNILSGVLYHHERTNGMGYPSKLKRDYIPLFARISAVSDVYDAMVSKRPYKNGHSPFEILEEFSASRFSDLDIKIVNALLHNLPKEFLGKKTLLSDGRIGTVISISPLDYAHPIVRVDNQLIKTNKYLTCLTVDDFIYTYNDK